MTGQDLIGSVCARYTTGKKHAWRCGVCCRPRTGFFFSYFMRGKWAVHLARLFALPRVVCVDYDLHDCTILIKGRAGSVKSAALN